MLKKGLLWEFFQNARIQRSEATADNARIKGSDTARRVEELEAEVETLSLALMAMWELMGKSNGFFMKDLEKKMQEIDLKDGVLDGKMTRSVIDCTNCGRRLGKGRKVCLYCGERLVRPLGSPGDV
ncbi:MAG: hypothetical protein AAGL69_07285 [Pseudomonadota bacterium]